MLFSRVLILDLLLVIVEIRIIGIMWVLGWDLIFCNSFVLDNLDMSMFDKMRLGGFWVVIL